MEEFYKIRTRFWRNLFFGTFFLCQGAPGRTELWEK